MNRRQFVGLLILVVAIVGVWRSNGGIDFQPQPRLIDVEGTVALVVYQDAEKHTYTQGQRDIIGGAEWTTHVDDYRILDVDTIFTSDTPYKAAFDRQGESPWCVISGEGEQYEGALPKSVEEMSQKAEAAHE